MKLLVGYDQDAPTTAHQSSPNFGDGRGDGMGIPYFLHITQYVLYRPLRWAGSPVPISIDGQTFSKWPN